MRGTWFKASDLTGVVIRGSDVGGMQIDSPWLGEGGSSLLVNGIDVVPLVDAQLNLRFPGRELRSADTPEGLRAAWAAVEQTWTDTMTWVTSLPAALVDASVDGEWSLAQTLRHLVMATDTWLGKGVLRQEQPYHEARSNPHAPAYDEIVLSCLHTILDEEWEHHRYVVRDLTSLTQ